MEIQLFSQQEQLPVGSLGREQERQRDQARLMGVLD